MVQNHPGALSPRRPRGRPRGVARNDALDEAVRVFWSNGYDGASISHLSRKMRLPKASLYQSYGDKEGLFLASIDRYANTCLVTVREAIGPSQTLATDLNSFFDAAVTLATSDADTPGCLISCVLADAAGNNIHLRQELDSRFTALEKQIHDRLVAGQAELRASANPDHAAMLLTAVVRGLMLRARAGTAADSLRIVGQMAVTLLCRA